MIGIINYGSGNIEAIANIYGRANLAHRIVSAPDELAAVDRVLLPGVGAFDQAMNELNRSGMRAALDDFALTQRKPVLGICVGMQLLAERSDEGQTDGLGWIEGEVKRFDHSMFQQATHLPHMGWNTVEPARVDPVFTDVDLALGYYFLHSYFFSPRRPEDVLGSTTYGARFASAVQRDNIVGVQFHPEKSHGAGIQLLRNFYHAEFR